MFKKKRENIKNATQTGLSLLGIKTKKLKFVVIILGFLFTIFLITAFMNTIQSLPSLIWWILSLICGLSLSAIIIFKR